MCPLGKGRENPDNRRLDKVEPLTFELIQEIDFIITSSRFPILYTNVRSEKGSSRTPETHLWISLHHVGDEGASPWSKGNRLSPRLKVNPVGYDWRGRCLPWRIHLRPPPKLGSDRNFEIRQRRRCPQMPRPRWKKRNPLLKRSPKISLPVKGKKLTIPFIIC